MSADIKIKVCKYENSETRQTFLRYKEQNLKVLRDALIVPAVEITVGSEASSLARSSEGSKNKSLIVPLINIVSEYSISLPNCGNSGVCCDDDDCKSRNYYFSSWQELIAHFPDFVQRSIKTINGENSGMPELASILRGMGTGTGNTIGFATGISDKKDRICELATYQLLSLEHSDYSRRGFCKRYLCRYFPPSLSQICNAITRPYNLEFNLRSTFWENFVPILWKRPSVEWTNGTYEADKEALQVRKQIAIRCIRDYHKFHNSTYNVDAANEQLILLVEHLLN